MTNQEAINRLTMMKIKYEFNVGETEAMRKAIQVLKRDEARKKVIADEVTSSSAESFGAH